MRNNQKGFSFIAVILVLIVVGVLGFIGWYVWRQRQDQKTTNTLKSTQPQTMTPQSNPEVDKTTEDPNKGFTVIEKWGVRIPSDKVPAGFSYTFNGNSGIFRSKALDEVTKAGCDSNGIIVARGSANDTLPNEAGSNDVKFKSEYDYAVEQDDSKDVKNTRDFQLKIGEYYYLPPAFSLGSCAAVEGGQQDKEQAAMMDIVKAIAAMEAAK